MSSIYQLIDIEAPAPAVWDAVRDWPQLHKRLVPGLVTATEVDGQCRIVTFAGGSTVRELILSVDDVAHRLAYSAVGGRAAHHNASMQVFQVDEARCQLVWITDLLPDTLMPSVDAMVEEGAAVIKRTLEGR